MFVNNASKKALFLILCGVGLFAILSSTMSKNPVLKPFSSYLGAPDNLVGLVAAASTIPGILLSFPAASLSDVFGRQKILLISTLIFASAPFLYLFIDSWWQLIPIRFYHGFATAIFVPVSEAYIAEMFPTKLGERMSIFSSISSVGRAIAPFLGGYILFITNYGYSSLYLSVGVAGLTAFLVCLLFLYDRKKHKNQENPRKNVSKKILKKWKEVATNTKVLNISIIQAMQYYVFGSLELFLVGYMVEVAKIDAFSIGIVMGSQIISLLISRPLLGWFSDRKNRQTFIILGSFTSAIVTASFAFTTSFFALIILSICYGSSFAAVISSTSPLVCENVSCNSVGSSLGFVSTMMDVGQTLGPIISGMILGIFNEYNQLFFSLSLLLVGTASIYGLQNRK